jgi:hypothetical protein
MKLHERIRIRSHKLQKEKPKQCMQEKLLSLFFFFKCSMILVTPQRLFCELAGTKFCLKNFKISNCKASQPYFTEIRNRNSFSVKEKLL